MDEAVLDPRRPVSRPLKGRLAESWLTRWISNPMSISDGAFLNASIRQFMDPPKKPAHGIVTFQDAQSAIDGTLETWLPRLVESNAALEEALLLLRDLYLAQKSLPEDVVLKRVQDALDNAARAKSAF